METETLQESDFQNGGKVPAKQRLWSESQRENIRKTVCHPSKKGSTWVRVLDIEKLQKS